MKRKKQERATKVIATLTADERYDYAQRATLHNTKKAELAAAAHYLDLLGEEFITKYSLPPAYNMNLQTGEITAAEVNDA